MKELRQYNLELLNQFKNLEHRDEFSFPLLVSSNTEYLEKLKTEKNRILYIGQETNGWVNYNPDKKLDVDTIEDRYLEFIEAGCNNKEFWRFIKQIMRSDNVSDNVIWTNSFIAGSKDSKGAPIHKEEINEMSINNLIYLYQYFKPTMTLIVSGPNNPYYSVVNEFLKSIDSSLTQQYPRSENILVGDETNNIYWTYHPNYLQRKGQLKEVSSMLIKRMI